MPSSFSVFVKAVTNKTMKINYKSHLLIILSLMGIGLLASLFLKRSPGAQIDNHKLQITTSFYPLYYFVSEIGGDKVNVVSITPSGAEPHDYEPTSQDIIQIMQSRVLFLNGGVEPWGQKIKENLQNKNTLIVEVGQNLMSQTLLDEDGQKIADPHILLSPILAKKIVDKIVETLVSVDQTNQEYYLSNSVNLQTKLDQLDRQYKMSLQNCKTKDIITSHAAFGYLASTYGLKQIAIAGLSPDAEPSLQGLAKIATFAKENHIQYIFFESLVSPKLSDTVAKEIGAKTLVLNPLEGLSPDEVKLGKNYLTEMENNLQNLKIALGCQ